MSALFKTLVRIYFGVASRFRNLFYRALGVQIDGYVWIRSVEIPRNWGDIKLEQKCALDKGVVLLCSGPRTSDKIRIGYNTYINRKTMLDAHKKIWIGKNVMIGPSCYITDSDHGILLGQSVKNQPMKYGEVIIEDDVWIGAHVIILKNVRVGRGAIVAAGAVVTRDVQPDTIVAGIPAKTMRKRN